jgi:hypothetical protein
MPGASRCIRLLFAANFVGDSSAAPQYLTSSSSNPGTAAALVKSSLLRPRSSASSNGTSGVAIDCSCIRPGFGNPGGCTCGDTDTGIQGYTNCLLNNPPRPGCKPESPQVVCSKVQGECADTLIIACAPAGPDTVGVECGPKPPPPGGSDDCPPNEHDLFQGVFKSPSCVSSSIFVFAYILAFLLACLLLKEIVRRVCRCSDDASANRSSSTQRQSGYGQYVVHRQRDSQGGSYCSGCGARAQGNFCSSCGSSLGSE